MTDNSEKPDLAALLRSANASAGEKPDLTALLRSAQTIAVPTHSQSEYSSSSQLPQTNFEPSHASENATQQLHNLGATEYEPISSHVSHFQHRPGVTPARPAKSSEDPRIILTWPAALRYVSSLLVQDPVATEFVRRMIANQHENEKSWWMGRQALLRQQASREDGRHQLNDVLRSIGGQPINEAGTQDPAIELKNYDKKVHAATKAMIENISSQLSDMGIPFFCINETLIADTVEANQVSKVTSTKESNDNSRVLGKINKEDLEKMRKKMVDFLEEYCKQ